MSRKHTETQLEGIAALGDPVRRALYLYVVAQAAPVGREEAARAVGIARGLAAFHLDRLVDEGLLSAEYRRLSGRGGPGAGRPSKVYRRSEREIQVTVPPRNYELAARMLIRALEGTPGSPGESAEAAEGFGRALGVEARRRAGRRRSRARLAAAIEEVLAEHGFEPLRRDDGIELRNCPFDALARDHRELVCGMNLAAMRGLLDEVGGSGLEAVDDPRPDTCCVMFRPAVGSAPATL